MATANMATRHLVSVWTKKMTTANDNSRKKGLNVQKSLFCTVGVWVGGRWCVCVCEFGHYCGLGVGWGLCAHDLVHMWVHLSCCVCVWAALSVCVIYI